MNETNEIERINKEMIIKMQTSEGKVIEFDVLFTCESEMTGDTYIVYADRASDESERKRVYMSICDTVDGKTILKPITIASEMEKLVDFLKSELSDVPIEIDPNPKCINESGDFVSLI